MRCTLRDDALAANMKNFEKGIRKYGQRLSWSRLPRSLPAFRVRPYLPLLDIHQSLHEPFKFDSSLNDEVRLIIFEDKVCLF